MNFYIEAFCTFFKIGLFTIGGGYAMVPLIEEEVVNKKKWLIQEDFIDLLAVSQSVPGVFAVNISIFIGYKLKKFPGALALALGAILPSFLIILGIALFFQRFKEYEAVENIFKGIRPAVVALIAAPTFTLAKSAKINKYNVWIPIISALLIWLMGVSPVYIIAIAGIGGFIYGKIKNKNNRIH
ncbi:MAG: chromate transporter [Bacteroides sp.]|nr:chromate transporter [Bacteroides sp.]